MLDDWLIGRGPVDELLLAVRAFYFPQLLNADGREVAAPIP